MCYHHECIDHVQRCQTQARRYQPSTSGVGRLSYSNGTDENPERRTAPDKYRISSKIGEPRSALAVETWPMLRPAATVLDSLHQRPHSWSLSSDRQFVSVTWTLEQLPRVPIVRFLGTPPTSLSLRFALSRPRPQALPVDLAFAHR